RRTRCRVRLLERRVPQRRAGRALDLFELAAHALLSGSDRVRPLPPDADVARRIPARPRARPPRAVKRIAALLAFGAAAPLAVAAQHDDHQTAAQRAESLRLAGRPWHAAETLLAAAARELHLEPAFVLAGAKAELRARRYDRARVTRDTAVAFRLLADLPPPAAREVPAARAQALLVAGDSAAALEAFAQAGRALEVARLALARGDSGRARDALYGLMARAPETDDAAAAVGVALASLPPRTPPERVALARAMKPHGAAPDARMEVERAVRQGDSSAA